MCFVFRFIIVNFFNFLFTFIFRFLHTPVYAVIVTRRLIGFWTPPENSFFPFVYSYAPNLCRSAKRYRVQLPIPRSLWRRSIVVCKYIYIYNVVYIMFRFTSIYTEIQHTTGLGFSYVGISATVLLDVWFVINGRLASETTVKKKISLAR